MLGRDAPITISERQWLQVKLDILGVLRGGSELTTRYVVGAGVITCSIYTPSAGRVMEKHKDETERLSFFAPWAERARNDAAKVVADLPSLAASFDPVNDIRVVILDDYGKGSIGICTFNGAEVTWHGAI